MSKPPVNINTLNDSEGVAKVEVPAPAQGAVIPPTAVPWLTALVAVALVVSRSLPAHTIASQVAGGLVDVAVLFGLASPGWRRKE